VAKIGYARVSTADQHPEAQATRLREHGCGQVFTDHGVSGKLASRPQWDACRGYLRDGDALVVTKLDRIGRSVGNLIEVVGDLGRSGVRPPCRRASPR
jgi:DNA invertase Pin-like site-specific DNA recombinase